MQNLKIKITFALAIALAACTPKYTYRPEISGEGGTASQQAILYSIPATNPQLKMKLISLGINTPPKDAHFNSKDKLLQVRMYFWRPAKTKGKPEEYVDPSEQLLRFTDDGQEMKPVLVHASSAKRPLIALAKASRQVVELFYALPESGEAAKNIFNFSVTWKVHYAKGLVESQTTRFDRHGASPHGDAYMFYDDPLLPFGDNPYGDPELGWPMDWGWW